MVDIHRQRIANRPPSASARTTYSRMALWLTIGALYVGLALLYGWNHKEILHLQYQLEDLKRDNRDLQGFKDDLRAEYKALTTPERIDRRARQLGLISSNQPDVTVIQAGEFATPAPTLRAEAVVKNESARE